MALEPESPVWNIINNRESAMYISINKQNSNSHAETNKNKEKLSVYLPRDIGVVVKSEVSLMKLNGIIFAIVTEHFTNGH